jgi:hypothetical protein
MLRNYVTDTDLKAHYPNIDKQLWPAQATYAVQIAEAFDHLQNDLWNKGIAPRLCMTPLDLRYAVGQQAGAPPVIRVEASSQVGQPIMGMNERRLVLSVIANTGVNVIKVQGSNDPQFPPNASTWVDINGASISLSGSGSIGTQTVQFADQFRVYRYVSTIGGSSQFSVSLVEVIFDHAIVMGAFKLIFRDFVKEKDDIWDMRRQTAELEYENNLEQIKYGYDLNDTGTPLVPDEMQRTGQMTFLR